MSGNLVAAYRIECNGDGRWSCVAFFEAMTTSTRAEARREARAAGWRVNVPNARRGARRLDYCPEHR